MKYQVERKGGYMVRRTINIINIRKKKRLYIKAGASCGNIKVKGSRIYLNGESFLMSLARYISQTVTIYTVSGGQSGAGFTGVLLEVCRDHVRILTSAASPPAYSLGDSFEDNDEKPVNLGSIAEVPLSKIAAFIHNAV
jgi:hypothetical protein